MAIAVVALAGLGGAGWFGMKAFIDDASEVSVDLEHYSRTDRGIRVIGDDVSCTRSQTHTVRVTSTAVEVTVVVTPIIGFCPAVYQGLDLSIDLGGPLYDRVVYDGGCLAKDRPRQECRLTERV